MGNVLSALGFAAALVAVYYAWRSASLGRLERRERALRAVAHGVDDVRDAAEAAITSYNDGRAGRGAQGAAAADFRRAQTRLRLTLADGALPEELLSDGRRDIATLISGRPLHVGGAAARTLDAVRSAQSALARPGPLERALRRRGRGDHGTVVVEGDARPCGGYAVRTESGGERRIEVVRPADGGGLEHVWCDADRPSTRWSPPRALGDPSMSVSAVSVCRGEAGEDGSLEVVVRAGGRLFHLTCPTSFAVEDGDPLPLSCGEPLPIDDAHGAPAIIQSGFGNRGNFEVVCPREGGGVAHLWRDNDAPEPAWARARSFGRDRPVDAVALIHADLEQHHLEVIARSEGRLCHFWRSNGRPAMWSVEEIAGVGADPAARCTGTPAFIQSRRRGSRGNFEVLVPLDGGGLAHLWRENDEQPRRWRARTLGLPPIDAAAVFEGPLADDGGRDLLVVARGPGGDLFLRDPQPPSRAALTARRRGRGRQPRRSAGSAA